MNVNRNHASPNYDPEEIPVEFIVLHYTAGDLDSTLALFLDATKEVSSHLIITENGEIFELVKCWDEIVHKAWHAGRSHWTEAGRKWEEFNNFSIGIEIVNLNGNLFPFSNEQYEALALATNHFRSKYNVLASANRIIGHEQIAGWRGKVDPGYQFDWPRYYGQNYPDQTPPRREYVCHPEIVKSFSKFRETAQDVEFSARYWHAVSHAMETSNRVLQNKSGDMIQPRR